MENQTELYRSYNAEESQHILVNFMIPAVILLNVVAIFGIFGNLNIIYATIVRRSFRRHFHFLLAVASLADCMHLCSAFILAFFIVTNKPFISLQTCLIAQFIPLIGSLVGNESILIIAVDRLICVASPQL
ncbi:serpentine type 7TM GPCR chemoreceptor srsx domain-containing protein [Ditylenchus destructor]|uniref:Serpentine type 7TM GPCR chemoreceptor srsx domain-containing protein n=1 Tax=Ditylenchus destructor TaxID=166010 RepID=A0AAD4QXA0_9BILA|nr:serpentine type 7TM GPCR chemoreceptor srsx domain-containing protein [Ditylenchus destructor]